MRRPRQPRTTAFLAAVLVALSAVFSLLGAQVTTLRLAAAASASIHGSQGARDTGRDAVTSLRSGSSVEVAAVRRARGARGPDADGSRDVPASLASLASDAAQAAPTFDAGSTRLSPFVRAAWRPAWRLRSLLMVFLN